MTLDKHFRGNACEIARLNQRGGRMLSLVDLVRAGTLSLDGAAWLASRMACGASLLTAAQPGGAGKTTIMAALLGFIPPHTQIVTADDPKRLDGAPPNGRACYLAHEIGRGPHYAYLWGNDACAFFEKVGASGASIASNLHADTMDELTEALVDGIALPLEVLRRIDLIAFIRMQRSGDDVRRWVNEICEACGGDRHRLVWTRPQFDDSLESAAALATPTDLRIAALLEEFCCGDASWTIEALRTAWLETAPAQS